MKIELDEHPAREALPAKPGEPVEYVPMFPEQKLIRLNGIGVGYLSLTSGGIHLLRRLPLSVRQEIEKHCEAFAGLKIVLSQPPEVDFTEDD